MYFKIIIRSCLQHFTRCLNFAQCLKSCPKSNKLSINGTTYHLLNICPMPGIFHRPGRELGRPGGWVPYLGSLAPSLGLHPPDVCLPKELLLFLPTAHPSVLFWYHHSPLLGADKVPLVAPPSFGQNLVTHTRPNWHFCPWTWTSRSSAGAHLASLLSSEVASHYVHH